MGLVRDHGPDGEPIYDPRHLCHAPQERVFIDGRWREGLSARGIVEADGEAAGGAGEALAAFETQVRRYRDYRDSQGRRAFALPVAAATTDPQILALDRISMREYFDRAGWDSPRLRWVRRLLLPRRLRLHARHHVGLGRGGTISARAPPTSST